MSVVRFRCLVLSMLVLAAACSGTSRHTSAASSKVVRVARSKQLTALAVLEQDGKLERALAPLGFRVEWLEFLAGPQQFEAFNSGALDITYTAESPPVFAQAAQGPVTYLAATASNGGLVSLLVPPGSPARSIKDLKGKRIAFQKASIGHYLTIRALEQAGLSLGDIEQINLAPPDASPALANQSIDAWFIWEPFVTRSIQTGIGRVLLNGEALRDTTNFVTVARSFADQHPEVVRVYLETLHAEELWCAAHRAEVAQVLSPRLAIDVPTLEAMHDKTKFGVFPITEHDKQKQQEVADMWWKQGFLPRRVEVLSGFLPPERYDALLPRELVALASAPR